MGRICRAIKRQPGSPNELFDATGVLDPLDLHAAADIDSEWLHLPNRGANVAGIEPTPEQDWYGGTHLFDELPISTRSGSARASLCVAFNQDS
jgi:hypothetical protein